MSVMMDLTSLIGMAKPIFSIAAEEEVALLEYLDEHKEELSEAEQRMVYRLLKDIRQKRVAVS